MISWQARRLGNLVQVTAELQQDGARHFDLVCVCEPAGLPDLVRQMAEAMAMERLARADTDWPLPARDAALNIPGGGCDACQ
ncbi:hypothetical protein I5F71_02850 [Pseudomonas aeruginosa]|nr:hypothetical protein [Pseudomonas aeruginosa]MBG4718186.1 hypothetical protein [Pseudomonas aeruginosa]